MKHLTLIRHAKSSWKAPELTDFERPLNKRGKRDAPLMAARLARDGPPPDAIVASPARRARKTALAMAKALGREEQTLVFERGLYLASTGALLDLVQALDDALGHVALVGHNPGLTGLLELLSSAGIANVPTCGIARLELGVVSWRDTAPGCAELMSLEVPKQLG
jgi:phosphohistidine phosphatase